MTMLDPQRVELLRAEFERSYAKRWCDTAERVNALRNGNAYVGQCLTSAWEGYQMAALAAADAAQPTGRDEVLRDLAAERARQVSMESWTNEHDDRHIRGELGKAAAVYAHPSPRVFSDKTGAECSGQPIDWPWDFHDYKPRDRRANLVRAGALILAEIERLDRAALATTTDAADGGEAGR